MFRLSLQVSVAISHQIHFLSWIIDFYSKNKKLYLFTMITEQIFSYIQSLIYILLWHIKMSLTYEYIMIIKIRYVTEHVLSVSLYFTQLKELINSSKVSDYPCFMFYCCLHWLNQCYELFSFWILHRYYERNSEWKCFSILHIVVVFD